MGLVLPSLFSELEGPALSGIVDEITKVPYLEEVVVGLDNATHRSKGSLTNVALAWVDSFCRTGMPCMHASILCML